jgi:superfamily I DNA/RNA helicase
MAKQSWYINESELDDYQVRIIRRSLQSSFIVKGCAGSGKTVLALWRAKELSEQGNNNYFVIVFTRALRQFIEDGIHTIGIKSSKVMYHWEWKDKGMPSADYLIVDEVQDFNRSELLDLKQAAKKHLILFGDSAQQLYKDFKQDLMTMEEIQSLSNIPMENLVLNHRLPRKIARIAENITTSLDPLTERCTKEGSSKPLIIKSASLEEQLDIIRQITEIQKFTDVGILFPKNENVKFAKQYYDAQNWKVEAKIGYGRNCMDLNFNSSNPKLMTCHSSKGLQFEAVFIPMCDEYNYKLNMRNPLYVAITRSYSDLYILYSYQMSNLLKKIDESLFHFENISHESTNDDDIPF